MEKETYSALYKLEGKYWWFAGRRYLLFNFINKYFGDYKNRSSTELKTKKLKILEVGCGTGKTMEMLKRYGDVYGIDYSDEALGFCRQRGLGNLKLGSVENLPYKDGYFDFVTCLDVLYHKGVEDDVQALKEINRVLVKGGYLFVTDAAMKCLWSRHDLVHHTKRRYSRREMKDKLLKAGFRVKKITYFNTILFPFIYAIRKAGNLLNLKPGSDVKEINPFVNFLLKGVYVAELFFVRYGDYPFGVSIFAVARKV